MVCDVCGGEGFVASDYRMASGQQAPAFKCVRCGALNLDETAVSSEEDRDSVRLAKAARAAALTPEDR